MKETKITTASSFMRKYLDWSYQSTRDLAQQSRSMSPIPEVRALDVPQVFTTDHELAHFCDVLREAGYSALHIGITQLWQRPERAKMIRSLFSLVPLGATHGTSIKLAFKSGVPYHTILQRDREMLDDLDPTHQVPVNYDLFFGNDVGHPLPEDFSIARATNLTHIAQRLGQPANEWELISELIDQIMTIYSTNDRPLTFEIPGTKGWSMFPELTNHLLEKLREKLRPWANRVGVCIDLGHLLTWSDTPTDLRQMSDLLREYHTLIHMVHLSSAASRQTYFQQAYAATVDYPLPDWHHQGLDLMLPMVEASMIELVDNIRHNFSRVPIEVCETRPAEVAVADYLPMLPCEQIATDYRNVYFEALRQQAQMLGYNYD